MTLAKKSRIRGQELQRHSSFVEDGRALFLALGETPGVTKVKQESLTGRRSKIRRITITPRETTFLVTIGTNDGHQMFRVFAEPGAAAALHRRLTERFPNYLVTFGV